jgi:NADH dehydrogenase
VILVAGATGMLGSEIVRRLLEQDREVRILVRPPSDYAALVDAGAQPVIGDFKDPPSLQAAADGVDTVVTTANSARRGPPDTVEAIDLQGNQHLIEAAMAAGVKQFIFLTGGPATRSDSPIPFVAAKGAAEDRLRAESMPWTILAPDPYFEVWVEMVVAGPAMSGGEVVYIGSGERRHSMISIQDVAQFAVASVANPAAHNRRLEIGGPEPISWKDAVSAFERALGRPIRQRGVPPDERIPSVPEQVKPLLASLDMYDSPMDTGELAEAFGVAQTSIEDYARARVASAQA